ncbi:MATE family efflux transporter [Tepidicaulis sp. LMO-SS28]|uniref:MATE family efflux transporter n=1 Tax=Tepidicaulis sp. LMO-SS28 TaxID=3447455 RepID=UPI003EE1EA98
MARLMDTSSPAVPASVPPLEPVGLHIRRTVSLAFPVVLARAGMVGIFTADTIMVGHYGSAELAYLALGIAIQSIFLLMSIGLLQGTMILASQAYGASDWREAGAAWRAGLYHAVALGVVFGIICVLGEPLLLLIGQPAELAAGGGGVSRAFGLSMPALLIYICSSYFLESIQRPRVGMYIMFGANFLNVGLNMVLIYGLPGFVEPMGAVGAAAATAVTRWAIALTVLAYILTLPWRDGEDPFGVRFRAARWWLEARRLGGKIGRRFRQQGIGMAVLMALDAAAFQTLILMAGYLGDTELAAYHIVVNAMILILMMAIGCSSATSVRVGNAIGRNDPLNLRRAGWVGIGLGAALVTPFAALAMLVPGFIAGIYTGEAAVIEVASVTFLVAGLILTVDAAVATTIGALRGAGDVWPTMLRFIGSFYLIGIPSGYLLAFEVGLGAPGLLMGLGAAIYVAFVLLVFRFRVVSHLPLKRA